MIQVLQHMHDTEETREVARYRFELGNVKIPQALRPGWRRRVADSQGRCVLLSLIDVDEEVARC